MVRHHTFATTFHFMLLVLKAVALGNDISGRKTRGIVAKIINSL